MLESACFLRATGEEGSWRLVEGLAQEDSSRIGAHEFTGKEKIDKARSLAGSP